MYCSHTITDLSGERHRTEVMVGGMVAAVKFAHTKNPRAGSTHTKYAMFDLEDMSATVRCILWPEAFVTFGELVVADRILAVQGAVDRRPGSEEVNLIANKLIPVNDLSTRYSRGVVVRVLEDVHGTRGLEQLREIVRGYPGDKRLTLLLYLADGWRVRLDCDDQGVELGPELRRRVDDLLGPGNFRLVSEPHSARPAPQGRGNGRPQFARD